MNEHAHESVNVNVPHGMHGTRPALPPGRVEGGVTLSAAWPSLEMPETLRVWTTIIDHT